MSNWTTEKALSVLKLPQGATREQVESQSEELIRQCYQKEILINAEKLQMISEARDFLLQNESHTNLSASRLFSMDEEEPTSITSKEYGHPEDCEECCSGYLKPKGPCSAEAYLCCESQSEPDEEDSSRS